MLRRLLQFGAVAQQDSMRSLPRHVPLDKARALARAHWPLLAVLAVAAAARLLVAIAYRPALFFSDSWAYSLLAFSSSHLAPDRPSGYPALLWLLSLPGRNLAAITTVQHVAGLATGLVSYTILRRLALPVWAATVATALILLNGYAIVLEQTILAEAGFTLALMVAALLTIRTPNRGGSLAIAGLLLAAAITMRTVGLFAVPVWFGYLVWRHRRVRLVALGLASVALPLLCYAAAYHQKQGTFGITSTDGWFLYGRVAAIADCSKFRPPAGTAALCEPPRQLGHRAPIYYIWSGRSPANRRYGTITTPASNEPLKRFAVAVIRARPLAYAALVARDVGRYAVPGEASAGTSDRAVTLPTHPRTGPPWINEQARTAYFPEYVPAVHPPAAVARRVVAVARPPRPLLASLVLVTLVASVVAVASGGRVLSRLPEALLLTGMGVAMLFGSALTSGFVLRYLVPAVPLIVCGGFVAAADLIKVRRADPRTSGRIASSTS